MEHLIQLHIEKLPEGLYLATSDDVQGLIAQGRTIQETIEIARDVAKKLIEAQTGASLPTIAESFDWDPVEALGEHPEAIAGVEAALWCETIATIDELEFMLLPRLAGVAERAWASGPGASWAEYRLRLGPQAPLWHHRGWRFFTSSLVDWATSPTTKDIATP